jgi:sec-independent protein translocase protein TatB
MFDVGLSELVVIGVVALVVLGPERLPKVARTAGHLFGRLQRYVATVKADLNREMELSELSRVKQEVQEAARAFEQDAQQHMQSLEADARVMSASLDAPQEDAPAPVVSPTQSELLSAQEHGLAGGNALPASPVPPPAPRPLRPAAPRGATVQEATLDLGIEPVRGARS